MVPRKVNPNVVMGFILVMTVQVIGICLLMGPAIQHANFIWIGLVAFLLLLTSILLTLYRSSRSGKDGPIDLSSRKLNGAWWYGRLGFSWFLLQMLIYVPLIPYIIQGGWAWNIGIAIEGVITFAILLFLMERIAKRNPPVAKAMLLWSTFLNLAIFLVLVLYRTTPTHDMNKVIEQGRADSSRFIFTMGSVMGIWLLGSMYFSFKIVRAAHALYKSGSDPTGS
jgi:hypothetical protein